MGRAEIRTGHLLVLLDSAYIPKYHSVVKTEACPRNWICSSSLPAMWQSFAQVLRRSWGARLCNIAVAACYNVLHLSEFIDIPPSSHCYRMQLVKSVSW